MNQPVAAHTDEQEDNVCCVGAAWYIAMARRGRVSAHGPEGGRKSAGINTTEFQVAAPSFASKRFHRRFGLFRSESWLYDAVPTQF